MRYALVEITNEYFEKGDCTECPFSYWDTSEYGENDYNCVLFCTYDNCPIKIINTEDKSDIRQVIEKLEKYCKDKKNTEKTEISVLQLKRFISALEKEESKYDDT